MISPWGSDVILDRFFTFSTKNSHLVERCQQPLVLMRVVARRNWGSDRKFLTLLYTALIRSKIDYGSFLYSTAKKSHLERLDRVQYKAIRIIAGLLLCTSLDALEAEVNLLPLKFRRAQLMLQYFSRVLRVPDHPVTILYHEFYNFDFF